MRYQIGKLSLRTLVFIGAVLCFFFNRNALNTAVFKEHHISLFLVVFWLCIFFNMLIRSFSSKNESKGSMKQFDKACDYQPALSVEEKALIVQNKKEDNRKALIVMITWIVFNSIFFALYGLKIIKNEFMVLLSAFYFMADIICIVFWCPFQYFIMRNRCCSTCRIFNWDAIMIVTPLIVLNTVYSWSLVIMAFIFWLRWEFVAQKRYYRFSEITNKRLGCVNCQENICKYKGKYID